MSLRRVLVLAVNDLRLTVRNRSALIWMLLLPLALIWFMGRGTVGNRADDRPSLRVVDEDGGWAAAALIEALSAQRLALAVVPAGGPAGPTTANAARRLTIPAGFTQTVEAGEPQALHLDNSAGSSPDFNLAAFAEIVHAVGMSLGALEAMPSLRPLTAGAVIALPRATALAEFRNAARRPPLVTVHVTQAGRGHAVPTGFAQSVPGILTMTVLMMTLIYGAVFLTIEKRIGMLRRQGSLPLSRAELFAGKWLGRFLMAGVQIVLVLVAGRFLFGLDLGPSPGALVLVLAAYAAAVAGLAILLGALLSTPEQASAVGWLLSMALAGLGGCWWPSELVPRWLWNASHVLPTPWAMDAFHALISYGRGVDAVLWPVAALLGFSLVFSLLGARFLRIS